LFDASLQSHAARPALRFAGATLSYAALDAAAQALAAWLQADGVARGDRIALMLPNRPAFVAAALAAWRLGAVVVPLDPQWVGPALRHRLDDAGARTLVIAEECAGAFEPLQAALPLRRVLIAARGDLAGPWRGPLLRWSRGRRERLRWPGAVRLPEALARGRRLALRAPALGGEDIALLQYTGGTTDRAKGAVLLHRQLAANVEQCAGWLAPAFDGVPGDEPLHVLCALPLHQIFAFTLGMLLALRQGACLLMVDSDEPGALLAAAARRRVHMVPATQTSFEALLAHPGFDRVDWSSLVLTLAGGMAVRPGTAHRWFERTGCPIVEGYGLAEASPAVTCNPPAARGEWRAPGDVGLPLPGTEIRLLGEDGVPVEPGQVGEVAVRGPQVMAGYWQRPEDTARVMTPDRFLRTGDLGQFDERGHLQLLERKNDLILVSGFNVVPSEVEGVLTRMPGVRECAVIGVPDPQVGEAIKAVLVKADPASPVPSEADVRAFCETHLTGYKRPREVEFRSELPKTPLGAPLRRALRN
jgi:long-chain acyl-CoA synthetase